MRLQLPAPGSIPARMPVTDVLVFTTFALICGCGPSLETGELVEVDVAASERVAYAAIIPSTDPQSRPPDMVLALPSKSEDTRAIIEDANSIWAQVAGIDNVGVVVPSSDTARLFSASRFAGFAFGAEIYVDRIIDDVESRFFAHQPDWVLVDIGGNGRRLVNVLRETSGRIPKGYLVPSFSMDEDAIDKALANRLDISLIIGNRDFNQREALLDSTENSTIAIERSTLPPLFSVDDAHLTSVKRQYAAEIIGRIQAK